MGVKISKFQVNRLNIYLAACGGAKLVGLGAFPPNANGGPPGGIWKPAGGGPIHGGGIAPGGGGGMPGRPPGGI